MKLYWKRNPGFTCFQRYEMKWTTKLPRILPRLPAIVMAVMLLIIAIGMAKSAVAIRYSEKADAIMLGWSQQDRSARPANHEIEYVRKLLNRSIRLDSRNTTHYERLTQFHLWDRQVVARAEAEDAAGTRFCLGAEEFTVVHRAAGSVGQ